MSVGVSVVVCCHNSAERLPPTLSHLAAQKVCPGVEWEVVVVDNASTDETSQRARELWPAGAPAPLRVVPEPNPGLTNARLRGFAEARHEIISFIDDDNWVCPDWVDLIAEVMGDDPHLAACGSRSEAVCEVAAPPWFEQYARSYAVGTQGDDSGAVSEGWGALWGAGLNIRRSAWEQLHSRGFRPLLSGRKGRALTSGEDSELCFAFRLAGWGLRYEPRLSLQHYLPAGRLQWSYLRRLYRGFGLSSTGLDAYDLVLNRNADDPRERAALVWHKELYRTLRKLAGHGTKLYRASRSPLEGDADVPRIEYLRGRLSAFLQGPSAYHAGIREVLNARWRQTDRPTIPGVLALRS